MSEHMLHLIAPSRHENVGAVVGDLAALHALRNAVDDAITSGTGGAFLAQSDGEYYFLPVVQASDMTHVFTSYALEVAPLRSARETVPLRDVHGMMEAIRKSLEPAWIDDGTGSYTLKKGSQHETQPEGK